MDMHGDGLTYGIYQSQTAMKAVTGLFADIPHGGLEVFNCR